MKCKAKNRDSVGSPTENPPHSHLAKSSPKYGIANNKLVITEAPQKDICPHGKTYPKNAVPIVKKIITIPEFQAI